MIMTILFTRQLYPGPSPGGHFGYLLNMGGLSAAVITVDATYNKTVCPPSPPHPSSKIKVQGYPENTKTQYHMHPISGNIASQGK